MNVVFSVIFVLEIATAITQIEAIPNWRWAAKNKHKRWSRHHSETYNNCAVGHCVKTWNCAEADVVISYGEDSCKYQRNGPWVCCLVNNNSSRRWDDTNIYTSESPNNVKEIAIKSLKSTTFSTEKHGNSNSDSSSKPLIKDSWNRNTGENSQNVRPLGDIFKNVRENYPIYTGNKTVGTKVPNINVTTNTNYKKTTNFWEKYHTSTTSPNYYKRTTNLWDKSHTSTSSSNHYNRTTNLWDKSRTTSSPNSYNRTTHLWDKSRISTTSPNYKRTTNLWDKSHTSTSGSNNYNRTTNLWDKFHTSTSGSNNYNRTTHLWDKHRTSDSRIIFPTERVTRYTTSSLPTKRVSNKPWTPSTKVSWGYTTANIRRTVSTTTKYPYSKKQTVPTRASSWQSWGSSTTAHPTKAKETRRSSVHSTAKSTRRYIATTPLPNVNIHLCGIRDQRKPIRRRTREANYERHPLADALYSGNIRSRSRYPYERIVGGEEAEPFSWPWVVALYKVASSGGNRFLSAGSLINENFILTAAHLFTPEDLRTASYVAMLGTHDAQDAVGQYIVSSVLLHPKYEHRFYYNDIALLKLERKVVFNNYVMPVCLPSPNAPLQLDKDLLGKNVTVMGWGDESFGGKSSQVLKEATFRIVSRSFCNASYVRVASNRFPKGITADMLCAGDPKGGKDACQGDSGGPLTVIENRRYTQVGIVSFGYKCGDKEFPGVYTKVAPYISWIAENIRYTDDSIDYDYY